MPADAAEIARLAGRLTNGAHRAVLLMTTDWQFPGKGTFDANGAWAAWIKAKSAIDGENKPVGKHKRRAYRLNGLGVQLQQHLRARAASAISDGEG